ncbi:discoidin domain-containing protein [Geminisphaera colitermitum]|uniref:discoidin domain-containing protein n=1 Tax=Geminisphaera colitermitum TaxID=1148786 RepID=UPI00019653D9|nr:discoidin domain-containing protein [Geminisphaera colitermitum]
MKTKNLLRNFAIATIAMTAATAAHAAEFLLSDNTDRSASVAAYPGPVTAANRIVTGVTYSYLTDAANSANKGVGDTDASIISTDNYYAGIKRELLDGYSERGGGNNASNSSWQNSVGATILFDLNQNYLISKVAVSVGHNGNQGVGDYQVFVSTDNNTFTALGIWDGSKNMIDGAESTNPGRNTELSITATTLAEARYVKIFLTNWNPALTSRLYNQLAIGEVAIWGDNVPAPSVPEPAACALLIGATFLGLAFLRHRSRS